MSGKRLQQRRGVSGGAPATSSPKPSRFADEEDKPLTDLINWPVESPGDEKYDTLITIGLFGLIFLVYLLTLFPSVPGGDSGELIISAYQMSIAHPPGYPLFTILGKIFTYLPFGSVAWRVNLMSAMCGVVSAVFLYRTVARWSGNHFAGVLSATVFAFSPLIWTYTIQAEVFSMNNLLVNALLYLAVSYAHYMSKGEKAKAVHMAHLGALTGGFGVANQHTIVFIFVPIVFWVMFVVDRDEFVFQTKRWGSLLVYVLLGLAPYIHMYVSPQIKQGMYSWGDTGSIGGFIHHFLRKEYGTFQLYSGNIADKSGLQERIVLYFTRATAEVLYIGIPLAILGLWVSVKGKRFEPKSVGTLLAVSFFMYITVFYSLTNLPIHLPLHLGVMLRFFMQPNAILCIWLGLGFAYLESAWAKISKNRLVPISIVVLLASTQIGLNYHMMDQHENYHFYNYGRAILDTLPNRAVLLVGGDLQTNIPYYLHLCEGVRPDVDILSVETMSWDWYNKRQGVLFKNLTFPGYVYHPHKPGAYSMKQFLDTNFKKREFFLAGEWKVGDPSIEGHYDTIGYGIIFKVINTKQVINPFEYEATLIKTLEPLKNYTPPMDMEKYGPETWEYVAGNNYWEGYERAANLFLTQAFKKEPDAEAAFKKTIELLEIVRAGRPIPGRFCLKYLGAAYDHLRSFHPGNQEYEQKIVEVWSELLALPPDGDKEIGIIRRAVEDIKNRRKF